MPLQLGSKQIDNISGPISFSLLKPPLSLFQEYKQININAPIFMLFGDDHRSTSGMCQNCSCKKSGSCCMPIYDPIFLQELDNIASKETPIDIYTENFEYTETERKKTDDLPLSRFMDDNIICFNRKLRGSSIYKQLCATKTIRWQSADVRHSTGSQGKPVIEGFLHICCIPFLVLRGEERSLIDLLKEMINRIEEYFSFKESIDYCELLSQLFKQQNIFEFMSSKQSLIVKQIHKMNPTLKKKWLTYCIQHFQYVITNGPFDINNSTMKMVSSSFLILKEYFELRSKNQITNKKIDTILNNYKKYYSDVAQPMTLIAGTFLDLYYLARSFKPVEGKNPVLSLSYFGAAHSRHIKYFLKTFLLYESVLSIENTEDTNRRCLQIKPEINLSQLLNSYRYLNQTPKTPRQSQERERDKNSAKTPSPHKIGKKNSLKKAPCQAQPDTYEWIVGKGCHEVIKRSSKSSSPPKTQSPPLQKKKTPSPRKVGKKNSLKKAPCQAQPDKYEWIVGKGCHEVIKRSSKSSSPPKTPQKSPKTKSPKTKSPQKSPKTQSPAILKQTNFKFSETSPSIINKLLESHKDYYKSLSNSDKLVLASYKDSLYTVMNEYQQKRLSIKSFVKKFALYYSSHLKRYCESNKISYTEDKLKNLSFSLYLIRLMINDLNRIILDAPTLKDPITICRGVETKYFIPTSDSKTFTHLGFLSFSLNEPVCETFRQKSGVIMYTTLQPGTNAFFMEAMPNQRDEQEILLPTCLDINIISKLSSFQYYVDIKKSKGCQIPNLDSYYINQL